jgi:hypothetical protein
VPLIISKRKRKTKADPLLEAAAKQESSLSRAAYSLLRSLQDIENPHTVDVQEYLLQRYRGAGLPPGVRSMHDAVVRAMESGAKFAIANLDKVKVRKVTVGTAMSFTLQNPQVAAFLAQYGLDLIRNISADAAAAIRLVLLQSLRDGTGPRETARLLTPLIGLSARQAQAVTNYRNMLASGNFTGASSLSLRDKRFDGRLKPGVTLTPDQIDKMVARYAERQLRYRATMIARTESIRALNQGQLEAWRQAKQQGLIDGMREQWLPGPEACRKCESIPGMNVGGVAIGGMFTTPFGLLDAPPAHPNCRCALGLE